MIVCADLDDQRPERRIFLAAPVDPSDVEHEFASQVEEERVVEWDDASQSVVASERERLGAIVLREAPLRDVDPAEVARVLAAALRKEGVAALPWSDAARKLRERLAFLHHAGDAWPDVSDAALTSTMDDWLAPRLFGLRKRADVGRADLADALLQMLTWEQRRKLDELAPTHIVVPTGSRIPVDYSDVEVPSLSVRLQEVFGMTETPRVGGGKVPVVMHLLSPAQRPVQVTRDLAGFWKTSYFDVKKEMKGRYPRHVWPDDPLTAEPTRRAKPRGT